MRTYYFLVAFILFSSPCVFSQTNDVKLNKAIITKKIIPQQVYGRPKKSSPILLQQDSSKLTSTKLEDVTKRNTNEIQSYISDTIWNLEKCVLYAREQNLQISAQELNERMANLTLAQLKASRLPNLNSNINLTETYGRSIDPTSNQFVTKGFLYNTIGLQSQTLVFGWFQKKYQIDQGYYELEATHELLNQLKDDISLNVATGFLRVLLAREQVKVSEAKLKLNQDQYVQTEKFVNAGKLPELNLAQMEAQVANDSSIYISSISDERIALLQLRALLNLDFDIPFDIIAPDFEMNESIGINSLPKPEEMLGIAFQHQHKVKFNELKLLSAQKTVEVAKATQYPQIKFIC